VGGLPSRTAAHGWAPRWSPACRRLRRSLSSPLSLRDGTRLDSLLDRGGCRLSVKCRHGGKIHGAGSLSQRLTTVDTYLVQLEKLVDGLWIALSGQIQKPPALIEFFLFRMRSWASFHAKPFLHPLMKDGLRVQKLASARNYISEGLQLPQKCRFFVQAIGARRQPVSHRLGHWHITS